MRGILCGLLLWGCSEPSVPLERSLPIIGGDPSDAAATVLLFNVGGGFSSCSGSVIAPRVVVTAKHCLGRNPGDPEAPQGLVVLTRPSLNDEYHYPVVAGQTTPGDSIENLDFAILIVDRDIDLEGAPYYEIDRDPADLEVGTEVRLIGYGLSDANGEGKQMRKLETTDAVTDPVVPELLYTWGRGACSGDSGGTVLDPDGRLVAVMTRADCAGMTISERVDFFLDLVDWGLEETGICVVHEEECDGIDNDCDDFPDEGCRTEGEVCIDDRSCADGLVCEPVGPGSLCVPPCEPFASGGCAAGSYCDATGPGEGRCLPGVPGSAAAGASCAADADCASMTCAGDACRTPCAPHQVACPWGLICKPDSNEGGLCEAAADDGSPRILGEPCGGSSDCAEGYVCAGEAPDRYCAPACGDGCPSGFHCREDICVRGDPGASGSRCLEDGDCAADDECVPAGDAEACAPTCDGGCDSGFACSDDRCLPEKAVLGAACASNADCASDLCGHFPDGARCTAPCSPSHGCPAATVCALQEDGINLLCREPPFAGDIGGGGCTTVPTSDGGGLFPLLAALCLARARRRPR
ncbi:MAG: trypsin-like serine protease [Deltaproteobacteria bacterium]|nr:trypsin-like serine protease [Deltaproteobacteria bacterium]